MALMVGATFVFGTQDALSRYLAESYTVLGVLLIRYWFFAGFVLVRAVRAPGGLRMVVRSKKPFLQSVRGVMLIVQVWMMVNAFSWLGLVETHALFASYPLMIAALAGPVLGERVTRRQWAAIGAGTFGVLLILRPGAAFFSPVSLFVLLAALNFAAYGLLTRVVGLHDRPETSFFYTGIAGAIAITLFTPWIWTPIAPHDWGWMALLCLSGSFGHYLLISAFAATEASRLQPLAYCQLIFASIAGIIVFGESLHPLTVAGAAVVVGAGLFNLRASR